MRVRPRGIQGYYKPNEKRAWGFHGEAVNQNPNDFQGQLKMIRQLNAIFLYPEDPPEVRKKFEGLSRKELKAIAVSPTKYGAGTHERAVVYRLREVFGCESVFNSLDESEAPVGTPMSQNQDNRECLAELLGVRS